MSDTLDAELQATVTAAQAPDATAFVNITEHHRGELQVHCYRMLGSFVDAEDHVQETLLKAWRQRGSFEGRSSLRTWLYRIATNTCLDTLRRNPDRTIPVGVGGDPAPSEIPWLQPYPDRLLDRATEPDSQPDAAVVAKENIGLAYLAAMQLLPANQRAVLIMRDVLGWNAKETADSLDTSVASANSALQRARTTLDEHRPSSDWAPTAPSSDERDLLARYIDAHARADTGAVVELLRADVRFTMPPQPVCHVGLDAVAAFFATDAFGADRPGEFRLVPTRANRQLAAANYIREWGDTEFRAMSLDVLRIEGGRIAEITTFEPALFRAFGLPDVL